MGEIEKEVMVIRELAKRVAEIAADPVHDEKKEMWRRINGLERVRPLIHVQAIDRSIWTELLPVEKFLCEEPFLRAQEEKLRRIIYCWDHFRDDRVVTDVIDSPIHILGSSMDTDYGIKSTQEDPENPFGASKFIPVIIDESDIDMIQTEPEVYVDWDQTDSEYNRLMEVYDGILRVEKRGLSFVWFGLVDTFIRWRGIEQTFVDLIERPAWMHDVLDRMLAALRSGYRQMEKLGVLSRSDGNAMLGSGGYGWTDQLPQTDFDGSHVRMKDMWARASTQIFTEGISPQVHDEFAIQYEKSLLEEFGLSAYGCCEPLHNKIDFIRQIGNLRRISLSPWVDIDKASAEVGTDYVYTHKPNPSLISMGMWDLDIAKRELEDALVKTRGNVVEINLQDLHTVQNQPERLTQWTSMAYELAERYA